MTENKIGLTLNVTPEQRDMLRNLKDREHRSYGTLFVWLAERYEREIAAAAATENK